MPALAVALDSKASARAGRLRLARMPPHCRSVCCLAGQPFLSRDVALRRKVWLNASAYTRRVTTEFAIAPAARRNPSKKRLHVASCVFRDASALYMPLVITGVVPRAVVAPRHGITRSAARLRKAVCSNFEREAASGTANARQ